MTVPSKMNIEEEIDELADELMEFGSDEYRKLEQELAMVCDFILRIWITILSRILVSEEAYLLHPIFFTDRPHP
jgi:hypothetical protein